MSAEPGTGGWQSRLATSPAAPWVASVIAVVDVVGMIAAATVVTSALVRDRPIEGLSWAFLPLVPAVAAGQLWMLGQMMLRQQDGRSVVRRTRFSISVHSTGEFSPGKQRTFFFGDLYPALAYLLLACAIAGWLASLSANVRTGNPVAGQAGCPYPLNNHGSITCVTRALYQHAGASQQRFAAGIAFGFFSIHLGAALGSLPFFRTRAQVST
jgi:hypothetical protein